MTTAIPFRPLPADLPADPSDVHYEHGPDSSVHDGVPRGSLTEVEWNDSAVYPGTSRRFWVHVPAQYDAANPPGLVVFQDGAGFLDPDDDLRGGVVLDNLIHRGDLPPTLGVFVDPGRVGEPTSGRNRQRNAEYDAPDDRYATFLLDEVVPEVARRWAVTDDHDRWGICGFSSGGNAALTAAWHRPDAFRRVIGFSSSFAQMPGGNPYPALLRTTDPKPLRVFLHVGRRDLGWDEPEHNWLAENLRTAAALAEASYDVRLELGDGGHDSNHAGVLLPDALRWAFS